MLTGEGVKQILYSEIEDIGKEKIQADITSSIELSQPYIDKIMSKCIARLAYESNDNHNDDIDLAIGTLCEALLHFMLTICTLPSERKVKAKNDLILDVVLLTKFAKLNKKSRESNYYSNYKGQISDGFKGNISIGILAAKLYEYLVDLC